MAVKEQWRSLIATISHNARAPLGWATIASLFVTIAEPGGGPEGKLPVVLVISAYYFAALATAVLRTYWEGWAKSWRHGAAMGFVVGALFSVFGCIFFLPYVEGYPPMGIADVAIFSMIFGLFPGALIGVVLWKVRTAGAPE